MSLKKLLGLEKCNLSEVDILKQIELARRKHLHSLEFKFNNHHVTLKITDVDLKGITWEVEGRYSTAQ